MNNSSELLLFLILIRLIANANDLDLANNTSILLLLGLILLNGNRTGSCCQNNNCCCRGNIPFINTF